MRERLVSCRLAWVGKEYIYITVVGRNAVLEYNINGQAGRETLSKRVAFSKYYKMVEELIKKYGYVFEKV